MIIAPNETFKYFQNKQKQDVQKQNKRNIKGAVDAGFTATLMHMLYGNGVVDKIEQSLWKQNKELSKDKADIIFDAANKVLNEKTDLSKSGVKIIDWQKKLSKKGAKLRDRGKISSLNQIAEGKNACFVIKKELDIDKNSILVNKSKFSLSVFHEMGHAFNCNNSKFWKAMQYSRMPASILSVFFTIFPALTKKTEPEEDRELTKGQKVVNFIRKHSPVLAAASFIPVISEEAMATFRGNGWAKELIGKVDKDLAKKVTKSSRLALITYIATAGVAFVSSLLARKIKDDSDAHFKSDLITKKGLSSRLGTYQG